MAKRILLVAIVFDACCVTLTITLCGKCAYWQPFSRNRALQAHSGTALVEFWSATKLRQWAGANSKFFDLHQPGQMHTLQDSKRNFVVWKINYGMYTNLLGDRYRADKSLHGLASTLVILQFHNKGIFPSWLLKLFNVINLGPNALAS